MKGVVATYGLTHIALAVRNVERAARFYETVFGAQVVYRQEGFVQLQTPGSRDVLVFEESKEHAGKAGGVAHFGFRLVRPEDLGQALEAVREAGGTIVSQGEFVPGEPYLCCKDPDGYEVEIWYELPTPLDPPARPKKNPQRRRPATRTP